MLRNVRIGARLNLGFGLMIVLLLLIGVLAMYQLRTLTTITHELYEHPFAASNALQNANTHLNEMHRGMNDLLLAQSRVEMDAAFKMINEHEEQVNTLLDTAIQLSSDEKASLAEIKDMFKEWSQLHDQVISLLQSNQRDKAVVLTTNQASREIKEIEEQMDKSVAQSLSIAEAYEKNASATAQRSIQLMGILLALIFISGLLLAITITQSITRPLAHAVDVAEQVSAGNLTVAVPNDPSHDEVAILMQTQRKMVENLRGQTQEMLEGISVLVSAASEIAATSTQLASSATETASSVSETTATVEEVKQTSRVATEKAQEVSERAQQTVQVSQRGEQAVDATVQGIHHIREQMVFVADSVVRLSEQSQAIGEIIASVDDLAEQSNLLAVNASIEAAKAGEQGKGFAVVAREVKSLAEQSRQATRQVRTILNDIQKATSAAVMATEQGSKAVEAGVAQSTEVGAALRTLAQSITDSAQMALQIVASSQQQYAGIDQVTLAMESIKEATSQNVGGARQLEEASRNLNELGHRLKQVVARYQV